MRLKALCDALRGIRGVHQLELVMTTALLPPLYEQDDVEADGGGLREQKPVRGARKGAAA